MHISCPQKADKKLTLQSSHQHMSWKPTPLPSFFFVDAARSYCDTLSSHFLRLDLQNK